MPVCLHCGEIGVDGALFCSKCGYTLPQESGGAVPAPSTLRPLSAASAGAPLPPPPGAYVPVAPPGAYAAPAAVVPGAVGPIAPPPSAKFCVRCRTVIARAAVYCPVCQQPQA